MYNLYPIRKMTTLTNARAIFLMELKEKTFIDISSHIFDTIVDETRTTSRPKLIFPSLLMRIFREKGVTILQDISPLPPLSAINKFTLTRIQSLLPGEEVEDVQEEGDPMEMRQRLQDRLLPHPEAETKGAELQLHQLHLLLMHFRSSWKDLMDSERFKVSILKG